MADPLNLAKPHRSIRCGVILMGGETEVLDVGPVDILHGLGKHFISSFPDGALPDKLRKQALDLEFVWVTEKGPSSDAALTSGISIKPTHSFKNCPTLDIVLIGAHNIYQYPPNETELSFVRGAYKDCQAFITICGGIEIPRLAGLLKGKTATGPRFFLPMYRKESPETNWVEKRWVRDGKLWTSGALLNGMDLMYNFCYEYWGLDGTMDGKGDDSLWSYLAKLGAWPNRDVDYKDVPWNV